MTSQLDALRSSVGELMPRALDELAALVAIPSVADERLFPREDCRRAGEWVRDAFREVGIADAHLAETSDGSAVVLGHLPGPPGSPTVLLYSHYDVQPPLDDAAWTSPPFTLTERDGRLYGRGAADCKGNIVTHLTALRALRGLGGADGGFPVGLRVVSEGSEEQGTGGLDDYVREHPEAFEADAMLIMDTGNARIGVPTLTTSLRGATSIVVTVEGLASAVHSGMFGGPAPDAIAALIRMLATLRDADGNTTVAGLAGDGTWDGVGYDEQQFRQDSTALDGTSLLGSGSVADELWARPAVTVIGIDAPAVVGSSAAIQPKAAARINLRVPPGVDAIAAQGALVEQLKAAAPWGVRVDFELDTPGQAFRSRSDGPAVAALQTALAEAFDVEQTVSAGQGGSIPLCIELQTAWPDAEIVLLGVEEPQCAIHAPNESVHPDEIRRLAVGEALFLARYGAGEG